MELFISPKYNLRFEDKETGEIKYAKVKDPWEALTKFGQRFCDPTTEERHTAFRSALSRSEAFIAERDREEKPWLQDKSKTKRRKR